MQYPFPLLSFLTNIFLLIRRRERLTEQKCMVKQPEATMDKGSSKLPLSLRFSARGMGTWRHLRNTVLILRKQAKALDILQPFWERRLEDGPCSSQSSTSNSPWSLRCEWRHCLRSFKQRSMRQHLVHTGRKRLQRCLLFVPFDVATKS